MSIIFTILLTEVIILKLDNAKTFRLLNPYERLNRGETVNKKDFANAFGISEKSVQRDIDDLRVYLAECYENGDDITVEVEIENNKIKHVHHDGTGCSICCSSASVMTEVLTGKDVEEAKKIIDNYCKMIKGEEIDDEDSLEEALVYQGVAQFPARLKCATIAWKAAEELLGDEDE